MFYDRFGVRQDRQGFYEDLPLADLVAHAELGAARRVVEFGCGTGRLAESLLERHLPSGAVYLGLDSSSTMARLAARRVGRFGARARVALTDGRPEPPLAAATADRFVSTYVLDLLSLEDASRALAAAHAALAPGGLVCLAGLSSGCGPVSRLVAAAWRLVHRLRPRAVGGCRPMELLDLLPPERWEVRHAARFAPRGIPSQTVVAARRGPAATR